jgi:hypothetical protein
MANEDPTVQTGDIAERVDAFRDTIAPDQYDVHDLIPWRDVDQGLRRHESAIAGLQTLVDSEELKVRPLAKLLSDDPGAVEVLNRLFVTPNGVGFRDGRELPAEGPLDKESARRTAGAAIAVGLRRLLRPGARVADLYRVGTLAIDARRRGYRRRDALEERVSRLIADAVSEVGARTGARIESLPVAEQPAAVRGKAAREVLAADGRPIAALATVIQSSSGGRQQRDLAFTYPRLQEDLDEVPMTLILIADGRGVADAPRRILEQLFEGVPACMSIEQAEQGELTEALVSAVLNEGARAGGREALKTIITASLTARARVDANDLPVPPETARLALSEYSLEHKDRDLELEDGGSSLRWRNEELALKGQRAAQEADPIALTQLIADALDARDVRPLPTDTEGLHAIAADIPNDQVLPDRLVIAATSSGLDEDLVTGLARAGRMHVAGASIALLLAPDARSWRSQPGAAQLQRSLATSVVVAGLSDVLDIVGAVNPRDTVVRFVLGQADLTKANPFNATGATRPEMFFGRQVEESDLISTLASNSAAVIGGRRIGKTSLLQHAISVLSRAGGWSPFYADLQEVGDWKSFAQYVELRWEVSLPKRFAPAAVSDLIAQLEKKGEGRLVIACDEVDNLLQWDQDHGGRAVREAFFRAARALSQEGRSQFVFSGERTIAQRLWDATSPHWNFCRPIPVKQLSREASDELLAEPLRSLGVDLADEDDSLAVAWERTQGHPHIVQFLGEGLVRLLNERSPVDRATLHLEDVLSVVNAVEFARHYITTYWGQATALEKVVSALICLGLTDLADLRTELNRRGLPADAETLATALQVLDLYGILDGLEEPITLRAEWFPSALEALGGPTSVIEDQGHESGLMAPAS